MRELPRVYIASKAVHGGKWLDHHAKHGKNYDLVSSWVWQYKPGETTNWLALWQQCIAEAAGCDYLVAYFEPDEVHSGVYVEMGAALGAGKTVIAVNMPDVKLGNYTAIKQVSSTIDAFYYIQRDWEARPFTELLWPSEERARFSFNIDIAVNDLPPQDVIQAVIEFTQLSVADELREIKLKGRMRELQIDREKAGMAYADTIKKYLG